MSQYTRFPDPASGIKIYPSATNFPADPGRDGVQAVAADTNTIYIYDTSIPGWAPVANPGAAIAIDALQGDVTATGPGVVNATVNSVGGETATDIATSVQDTQAATSSNTPSTIVKRDAMGEFSATDITISGGKVQTQLDNKQPFAKVVRITKSANYNVGSSDDYIGCDSTAASFTLTLPAANTVTSGKKYIIKDEGGSAGVNSIFISPSGTDTIDGVNASYIANVGYESITLVCNGANAWFII